MECFHVFDWIHSLHHKLLCYESSTYLRRVWQQDLLFYTDRSHLGAWTGWVPHTPLLFTPFTSLGLEATSGRWTQSPHFSHTEMVYLLLILPGYPLPFLIPSAKQHSILANSKITERNKKILSVLTNGFHLKAPWTAFSFIHNNMLSLIHDNLSFWSSNFNWTQTPKHCSPAVLKVALILAASYKPSERAPADIHLLICSQVEKDPRDRFHFITLVAGTPTLYFPPLCHHFAAAVTCHYAFTVASNLEMASRHNQGKLSWPICSNHCLTNCVGALLTCIYTKVLLKECFFSAPKDWATGTIVLFPESSVHSLLLKQIRMNSHMLCRLF